MDHSSWAFLLKVALQLKKDEEEEAARRAKKEQVKAAKEEWRVQRREMVDELFALGSLPLSQRFRRKEDRGARGCDRLQRFPPRRR